MVSEHKMRKELREKITAFLLNNFDAVVEEVNTMPTTEKIKFYVKLLPYGLGRMNNETDDVFERLTEDEMDELLEKLKLATEQSLYEEHKHDTIARTNADG